MKKGKIHTHARTHAHTQTQACTSYIKWHTRQANSR